MKNLLLQLFFVFLTTLSIAQESFVKGDIILKVNDQKVDLFVDQANTDFPDLQLELKEVLSESANLYLIQYDYTNLVYQEEEILSLIRSLPNCAFAQWNHNNIKSRSTPNDPSFRVQWNLKNVDAEKAWEITTGGMTLDSQEIVVAVIDEDCAIGHDDLKDNIWLNKHEIPGNNIDDDLNGYKDDYNGWNVFEDTGHVYGVSKSHGTMVTGMVGARSNNGTDIASVNWKVKILPVMGSHTVESIVLKSYNYVLEMRKRYNSSNGDSGAFIVAVNSSFGVDRGKPADYPAWCEMFNTMGEAGIISVGSGPNSVSNIDVVGDIPTTCPSNYLVAVTNINRLDKLNNAGYGAINMDIGAPGTDVISTNSGNGVQTGNGTSFASPMVSGAIALMYSALPKDTLLKYKGDQAKLASHVRKLLLTKGYREIPDLKGKTLTGGTLNLYRAVLAAIDSTDTTVGVKPVMTAPYSISMYPNPVKNELNIRTLGNEDLKIDVVDINGAVALSGILEEGITKTFNLDNLSPGVYLVKFYSPLYKHKAKRFVKE